MDLLRYLYAVSAIFNSFTVVLQYGKGRLIFCFYDTLYTNIASGRESGVGKSCLIYFPHASEVVSGDYWYLMLEMRGLGSFEKTMNARKFEQCLS